MASHFGTFSKCDPAISEINGIDFLVAGNRREPFSDSCRRNQSYNFP